MEINLPYNLKLAEIARRLNKEVHTLVEYLDSNGIRIESNPSLNISANYLSPEIQRILILKFGEGKRRSLENVASKLNIEENELKSIIPKVGIAFNNAYNFTNQVTETEFNRLWNYNKLSKYFDFDIPSEKLYKSSEVKKGAHGLEYVNGEYFASHFHLKTLLAKGELKEYLNKIRSRDLYGKALEENEDFQKWPEVQYEGQDFSIKKYKLSWIISLISSDDAEQEENTVNLENTTGIGFSNFRRFEKLKKLDLSPITYFVGRNNSGKSTLVKGLLLCLDYIKNQRGEKFSFSNQAMNDANIVTFGRAKCRSIEDPSIKFDVSFGPYRLIIEISGEEFNTEADVDLIRIEHVPENISFTIDYNQRSIRFNQVVKQKKNEEKNTQLKLKAVNESIEETEEKMKELRKGSGEYLALVDFRNKLKDRRNKLAHAQEQEDLIISKDHTSSYLHYSADFAEMDQTVKKGQSVSLEKAFQYFFEYLELDKKEFFNKADSQQEENSSIKDEYELNFSDLSEDEIEEMKKGYSEALDQISEDLKEEMEKLAETHDEEDISLQSLKMQLYEEWYEQSDSTKRMMRDAVYNDKSNLEIFLPDFLEYMQSIKYYYLPANPSKQQGLYSIRDKENSLAQTIHQFYQLNIQEGEKENQFVKKWMKEFEVGVDYAIRPIAGEAYEFEVKTEEGFMTSLSDMGMGSLQAMVLVMQVASLIRLNKNEDTQVNLLIEEPELNLHPKLQSVISNFLHEVYSEFGFKFLVETHSEYLIRNSQLIGLENDYFENDKLNPNPFSVYYFHKEEGPYKMNYTPEGRFKRDFGEGFYDVSAKLTRATLKKSKTR